MKDQGSSKISTKKTKKVQRKEAKKEVSKSLKDAINKHKKDQHAKKFAKPADKKDQKYGKSKFQPSNNKPTGEMTPKKSILKKDTTDAPKRKFDKTASSSSEPSEKKAFVKTFNNKKFSKPNGESSGKSNFKKSNGKEQHSQIDRKSFKPNFKLVEDLKTGWNKVRDRSTPEEVRVSLLKRMVDQMTTHVLQVTLRHDASRIVQTILQFGNQAQKDLMLGELAVKAYEISKTPYGHFTILKAITYCTRPADQRKIAAAFKGHFVSLGTNVIGSRTAESIMQLYPPAITRSLKAEFYGQKFCILLPEPPKSLRALIESLPAKESSIMDHMRDLVQKLVNKSLLEFTYVHHLVWEYTKEAASSPTRMADLVNQLVESAPKLLSTKPGAKVMCTIITHATAKDRKRILKTLKGHVLESLCHDSAYLGLMRLVDVTDDTVNVQKSLFDELRNVVPEIKYTATGEVIGTPEPPLIAIAKHKTGHKLLLRLLAPHKRHLEVEEEELFTQNVATSKKAPEMRRKEHVTFLKGPLVQLCAKYAEELMRSRSGSRVLEELVYALHPKVVIDAIARVYAGVEGADISGGEGENDEYFNGEDEEEEQEEEYDDEAVEGEEADEYGDEEEGEEGEEDDGDFEGDEEDADVDEEEQEVAAEFKEALAKQGGDSKKKPTSEPAAAAALLPIEEDSTAHVLLKKLLQFEAAVEARDNVVSELLSAASTGNAKQKKARQAAAAELTALLAEDVSKGKQFSKEEAPPTIDESMWQDAYSTANDESNSSLALLLLSYLQESGQLQAWLRCNRPCFALMKVCQVPSAQKAAAEALRESAKEVSREHEGGKLLASLCDIVDKLL